MHRRRLTWSVVVLAAAGSMWACGTDDDGGPDGSGGASAAGAGGHSAGGHSAGGAGSGGKAQGGSAGQAHGGANTGGRQNTGGEAGVANLAGSGGDNVGGDSAGGSGGDSAGGSAGDGSDGGAAGAPSAPTLEQNCNAVCTAQSTLSCTFGANCATGCLLIAQDPEFPTNDIPGYEKMIACEAKYLTTVASYECSDQGGPKWPAPKDKTTCNALICAWACADMYGLADPNVVERCNCP